MNVTVSVRCCYQHFGFLHVQGSRDCRREKEAIRLRMATRGSISFDDGALIAAYVDGHVDRRAIAISQNQTLPPSKGASMLPSPLVAPLPRS